MAKKTETREVGRDSGNGRFVPIKETEKRPKLQKRKKLSIR